MKFAELKKIAEIVDTSKPPFDPKKGTGPIPCIVCSFRPDRIEWLTDGRCSLCHAAFLRLKTAEDHYNGVFRNAKPSPCMGCSETLYNLDASGYCPVCRTSRGILITSQTKAYGPYWCDSCDRVGAVQVNHLCADCRESRPLPPVVVMPQKTMQLRKFYCQGCKRFEAVAMGGACRNCSVKIGSAIDRKPLPYAPDREPRLVKFTPDGEGGWKTNLFPVPNPSTARILGMEEKLGNDGRLGIIGE